MNEQINKTEEFDNLLQAIGSARRQTLYVSLSIVGSGILRNCTTTITVKQYICNFKENRSFMRRFSFITGS